MGTARPPGTRVRGEGSYEKGGGGVETLLVPYVDLAHISSTPFTDPQVTRDQGGENNMERWLVYSPPAS